MKRGSTASYIAVAAAAAAVSLVIGANVGRSQAQPTPLARTTERSLKPCRTCRDARCASRSLSAGRGPGARRIAIPAITCSAT